jgi:hypothetical protein
MACRAGDGQGMPVQPARTGAAAAASTGGRDDRPALPASRAPAGARTSRAAPPGRTPDGPARGGPGPAGPAARARSRALREPRYERGSAGYGTGPAGADGTSMTGHGQDSDGVRDPGTAGSVPAFPGMRDVHPADRARVAAAFSQVLEIVRAFTRAGYRAAPGDRFSGRRPGHRRCNRRTSAGQASRTRRRRGGARTCTGPGDTCPRTAARRRPCHDRGPSLPAGDPGWMPAAGSRLPSTGRRAGLRRAPRRPDPRGRPGRGGHRGRPVTRRPCHVHRAACRPQRARANASRCLARRQRVVVALVTQVSCRSGPSCTRLGIPPIRCPACREDACTAALPAAATLRTLPGQRASGR